MVLVFRGPAIYISHISVAVIKFQPNDQTQPRGGRSFGGYGFREMESFLLGTAWWLEEKAGQCEEETIATYISSSTHKKEREDSLPQSEVLPLASPVSSTSNNLPKQCHQLGVKHSNARASEGHFSFKAPQSPWQGSRQATPSLCKVQLCCWNLKEKPDRDPGRVLSVSNFAVKQLQLEQLLSFTIFLLWIILCYTFSTFYYCCLLWPSDCINIIPISTWGNREYKLHKASCLRDRWKSLNPSSPDQADAALTPHPSFVAVCIMK